MADHLLSSRNFPAKRDAYAKPTLSPLGDEGVLIRFSDHLTLEGNQQALAAARKLARARLPAVREICPNLVTVLVVYDPAQTSFFRLCQEVDLALGAATPDEASLGRHHSIEVTYGGKDGPHLEDVAASLNMTVEGFIGAHVGKPLNVLTVGFAPGFIYCGLHDAFLHLPRRKTVLPLVPAGTVLFAAGQTAITATSVPTGWHVIGRTDTRNFNPDRSPPVTIVAGDCVTFVAGGRNNG